DVPDLVQEPDALGQGPLQRLAAADQAHAAGPFVDPRPPAGGLSRPRRGCRRGTARTLPWTAEQDSKAAELTPNRASRFGVNSCGRPSVKNTRIYLGEHPNSAHMLVSDGSASAVPPPSPALAQPRGPVPPSAENCAP